MFPFLEGPTTTTASAKSTTTTTTTAERYAIQHPTKQCTWDTMLATLEACTRAMAVLDPRAEGGVKEDEAAKAPTG